MSAYYLYSQEVYAILPPEAWDEAFFSLLSVKHALVGVPGWKHMDLLANNHDDGTIHLRITTNWATIEQLETWLQSQLTVEGVLKGLTPPPLTIDVGFYEKIS